MCAPFPVMRSTHEQANLRWRLKTGGAVAIHCFTVAPRLGSRSRTSVSRLELVERRDQARSRGKAVLGSPFGPRRVAALCTPCSPLWGRLFTPVHQILFA